MCEWILLSEAAVLGGPNGPGVIISQVSYWAADSPAFTPSPSLIFIFIILFLFLSIILDLCYSVSTGLPPSLPLPTSLSKLGPILSVSLTWDPDWFSSAVFGPGLIPHNDVCASAKITANHAQKLPFSRFSMMTSLRKPKLRPSLFRKLQHLRTRRPQQWQTGRKQAANPGPTVDANAVLMLQLGRQPSSQVMHAYFLLLIAGYVISKLF